MKRRTTVAFVVVNEPSDHSYEVTEEEYAAMSLHDQLEYDLFDRPQPASSIRWQMRDYAESVGVSNPKVKILKPAKRPEQCTMGHGFKVTARSLMP
jgi:hypothetical protein